MQDFVTTAFNLEFFDLQEEAVKDSVSGVTGVDEGSVQQIQDQQMLMLSAGLNIDASANETNQAPVAVTPTTVQSY